jgi:hypothetical protein
LKETARDEEHIEDMDELLAFDSPPQWSEREGRDGPEEESNMNGIVI